jgi:RibD C-terminal domain
MRKLVVSTTFTDPRWANTEVVAGDVVARVRKLKDGDGGHIVQYGFGDVSRLLLEQGLFDQLQLWIHPQLVGRSDAADLLYRPGAAATFELVDSQLLSNGIILATYRPSPRFPPRSAIDVAAWGWLSAKTGAMPPEVSIDVHKRELGWDPGNRGQVRAGTPSGGGAWRCAAAGPAAPGPGRPRRGVTLGGTVLADDRTGPPLRDTEPGHEHVHGSASPRRAQKFPVMRLSGGARLGRA